MIPLRRPSPIPPGQGRRRAAIGMIAAGLALPLMAAMGGCQGRRLQPMLRPLEGTLYIAVGVSQEALDTELQKEIRMRTTLLQTTFRTLQPRVRLQVEVFPEENLRNELLVRNRTGLSPDLLLVNESTAQELARERLINTVPFPNTVLDQLDVGSVVRVRRSDGTLTGLPMELQPQVACFDRRHVQRSPDSLDELLAFSAKGMEVGLSLDAINLAWTLGPLGAIDAVSDLLAGKPATPVTRQGLQGWLEWLRMADQQQHVTVYPTETELLKGLMAGVLDWIPCRSINITRLRSRLGRNLGVAPLPSGPFGEASPITRERVIAFGVNSSPGQRQLALALARFAISPLHQRDMIQRNQYVLPVNREVAPPVRSSSVVAAMVEGRQQSLHRATIRLIEASTRNQREGWQALLTRYLFDDLSQPAALEGLVQLLSGGRAR
ncbi:extracellular solute-binding protein [Cyanobium sp. Lug-B]|uniref:extracellular solute-binding protein n=2 Tax=unclassified Cyanobium TaxID=2627006 RepID=UPI0020CB6B23|nr:extracellular solute-binding protein [Cyanobium sp. Lug-B]